MSHPRVLTFNMHEPYICLMAQTGIPLEIGLCTRPPNDRTWQAQYRAIPPNVTFVDEKKWRDDLAHGRYDVVIAQDESIARDIAVPVVESKTPAILLLHNSKYYIDSKITQTRPEGLEDYRKLLELLQGIFHFVYISDFKRGSYGIPGSVILPGIDVDAMGGYVGDDTRILRIGNAMLPRNVMFDVGFQEAVCENLPNTLLGDNPDIEGSTQSKSYEDLLNHYRSHRCYLHVTREGFEDGYNLALLEAMAVGMPVLTLANQTSPVTDGVDGYVATDVETLRQRAQELLEDQDSAKAMGERARETVARLFPIDRFTAAWRSAIEDAPTLSPVSDSLGSLRNIPVLNQYVNWPVTTGRYFETALRKRHQVVTAGYRIDEPVAHGWGFPKKRVIYLPHDIQLPLDGPDQHVASQISAGFNPAVYLWVDSGQKQLPADIDSIPGTKAAYFIDTHLAPSFRIEQARAFQYVFLAQRAQIDLFKEAGIKHVEWLPLACSPELHHIEPQERIYDWSYIGATEGDYISRRTDLIAGLRKAFPNNVAETAWPIDMAMTYAQSKIVVNACVNFDVNMRVFEAMAAGALLITDEADGLDDLFEEGVHYVRYNSEEELHSKVAYYLEHEEERQQIAEAGHAFVLARHTYDHRVEYIMRTVLDDTGLLGGMTGESRFQRGGYYRNERSEMLAHVPEGAQAILDVGCGGGEFGRVLKKRGVPYVAGIEIVERAYEMAKEHLDDVMLGNIEEDDLPFAENTFDAIFCNDVLEHLINPLGALEKLRTVLKPGGVINISIPNVRYHEVVRSLAVDGRWEYQDAGILDRTHLRFFTATELVHLMSDAKFALDTIRPLSRGAAENLPRNDDGSVTIGSMTLHDVSDSDYAELLTYQFLVKGVKPGARTLAEAQDALDRREDEKAYDYAKACPGDSTHQREIIMAKAAGRLGRLTEARAIYEQLISADPENVEIAGEYGILCVAESRIDDAWPLLARALGQSRSDDRVLAAMGLVHLSRSEGDQALDCFIEASAANTQNDIVIPHMIELGHKLDRIEEVIPVVRTFVDFFPARISVVCAYARMMADVGNMAEAQDRIATAQLMDPDNEELAQLRMELDGRKEDS